MFGVSSRAKRVQRPLPSMRLSRGFLAALPAPALLTVPTPGFGPRSFDFAPKRLGLGNTGALNGGITTTPGGFGVLGQAWNFDNNSAKSILIANQSWSDFLHGGPYTFAIGINAESIGSLRQFFLGDLNSGGGHASFGIQALTTGVVQFQQTVSNVGTNLNSATTIASGGNYLLSVTWNGASRRTYINSAFSSSDSPANWTGTYTGAQATIGRQGAFTSAPSASPVFFCGIWSNALTDAQVSSLYNCLFTGEPFPLFQPLSTEMFAGAAAGASASGAGGLVATSSLLASSLYAAAVGISTALSTIASSLQSAAAGIQAVASQSVTNNLATGSASIQSASLEDVLTNLAAGAAAINGSSIEQVLSNITSASATVGGSSAEVASSIISALGALQALSSQSTALVAQGVAHVAATGDTSVLTNLAQLQETLTSVATFTASSIYQASMSLSDSAQAQVVLAMLSVAEQIEALSVQLASSVELPQSSGGASATVLASNLYSAASRLSSSVSVSIGGLEPGDVDAIYYLPQRLKTFHLPPRTGIYYLPQRSRVYYLPQSRNN